METIPHHAEKEHPKEKTYIKVALVLAVITGIEIVLSYVDIPDWAIITGLLVLSLIKFIAVVGYFMHLKFDNPALRKPFITGVLLALIVYTIVLVNMLSQNSPSGA